ncbi:molecular chaperone DnaJ [Acinetobacter sp. C_4_1]|uniref:molecular chaperone DnaJ n=1 Tax=unclassified Acinetobacter TaxID=196816 RepID=UPI0021B7A8F0|nr:MULTISPECIES: molecular chaperone DnaJ [unclassified Acinetobacter]MCT8089812.1 molecular chaperone DnaJ [Acinetobacter sp. F_3_1]MCT8098008.1 molecular chaperone DnaJ [Acinetobacter sp. C_3_1]MCT8101258.1 molecular chaperone DnaJ [Acinetobacter sp. C_4_1]MCT8135331.1 molecular chaperone DnaJ [Acinetobacter sp. T_3_1]
MSFALKTTPQTVLEVSPQHQKLNRLIDEIEQQKQLLLAWQHAKDEIRAYSQKALMPAYRDLYSTLYEQMQTLWNSLSLYGLSKSDTAVVEDKIQTLVRLLQGSHLLSQKQMDEVEKMHAYFMQASEYTKKKKKVKDQGAEPENEGFDAVDEYEDWNSDQYQQVREQAKLKRQQDKQAQAEKLVNQSLKTVYLKIASIIHPDREPDDSKKAEKTELLQRANEAYEQEDLFFLLKLQLEVEQSKNGSNKGLSAEQVRFYQQALEAQSQALKKQIQELIDSLVWSNKAKIAVQKSKGQLNIEQLYKQIDADVSAVKQQLKAEKQRLMYMGKESGLEMLLEHQVL